MEDNKPMTEEEMADKLILEFKKKEEFLKAYKELVEKYGYDFMQQPPSIIKVGLIKKNQ